MNDGWIKLHRSFLDWEWFSCPKTCQLFIYCMLRSNHTDTKWRGIPIKRGQFLTSYEKLSAGTGLSIRNVRTALKNLESTGEVARESTSQLTKLTICKYGIYNNLDSHTDKPTDKQATHDRHTTDTRPTTEKKEKKEKKEKNKRFTPPLVDDIRTYCKERKNKVDPVKFFNFYESKGWMVGSNKMKDWEAAVRTWESKDKEDKKDISQWRPS